MIDNKLDPLISYRKAGEFMANACWTICIAVTAAAFAAAYEWWIGAAIFFALISLSGIHRELIRRRPKEK